MRYVAAIVVCSLFAPSAFAANEVVDLIPKNAFCVMQIDVKNLNTTPLMKKLAQEVAQKPSLRLSLNFALLLQPITSEFFGADVVVSESVRGIQDVCKGLQVDRLTVMLVDDPTGFLKLSVVIFIEGNNQPEDYAKSFKKYVDATRDITTTTETIGKRTVSIATHEKVTLFGANKIQRADVLLKPSLYVVSFHYEGLKGILENFDMRAEAGKKPVPKPGIAGVIQQATPKAESWEPPIVTTIKKAKIADSPMWLAYSTVSHSIAVAATVGNDLGLRVECIATDDSEAATIKMVDDYLANNAKQPKPQPLYAAAKITKNKRDKLNATYIAIIPAKTIIDHYKE